MQQDKETKQQHWDFATQWSLPKREALGFLIPGLFGYRMDTPEGGVYWGAVGRDPNWDRYFASGKQGSRASRHNALLAAGEFMPAHLVILVVAWTVAQGLAAEKGLGFFVTNPALDLVLARCLRGVASASIWALRPFLPVALCAAVLLNNSESGQIYLSVQLGVGGAVRLRHQMARTGFTWKMKKVKVDHWKYL